MCRVAVVPSVTRRVQVACSVVSFQLSRTLSVKGRPGPTGVTDKQTAARLENMTSGMQSRVLCCLTQLEFYYLVLLEESVSSHQHNRRHAGKASCAEGLFEF